MKSSFAKADLRFEIFPKLFKIFIAVLQMEEITLKFSEFAQ